MPQFGAVRPLSFLFLGFLSFSVPLVAQTASAPSAPHDAQLELVVLLSRHGVRPPLHNPDAYNQYSAAPWPQWDVPPGYLTPHGYQLMKLFGAWDRAKFSSEGLFAASGCVDAAHVSILADSDERTRETGKALAEGMFPGCGIAVHAKSEGTPDPLFSPLKTNVGHPDAALDEAAINGRVGGDLNNLVEAYRPQLAALDRVLAGCGHEPANAQRTPIIGSSGSLNSGSGANSASAHTILATASTLTENLLLEYTEGMSSDAVGWGCVDGAMLRELMQVNVASWDFNLRTPTVARIYASNLLDHIRSTLEQGVTRKPVPGALGKPSDRLVILVGHDTNLVTVSGALGIDWVLDGRVDDTPPGGALVFELWRSRKTGPFVRVYYTTQTLEQMRNTVPLTPASPPAEAPIFISACSRADDTCTWDGFSAAMRQAIDPAFVSTLR